MSRTPEQCVALAEEILNELIGPSVSVDVVAGKTRMAEALLHLADTKLRVGDLQLKVSEASRR